MITFVHVAVHFQPQITCRTLEDLPVSCGPGGRHHVRQAALDHGQVLEVIRHTVFCQYGLDDGKPAVGPFEKQQGGGLPVGVDQQFTVESFPDFELFNGYIFTGKFKIFRMHQGVNAILLQEAFIVGSFGLFC